MKNDNKSTYKFKWFKGFEMENPKTNFIEYCYGIAILIGVVGTMGALLIHVIAPNGLIH